MQNIQERFEISSAKTSCDGDAASPHPRVFLTINAQGFVDCPYCGKHFVMAAGAKQGDSH